MAAGRGDVVSVNSGGVSNLPSALGVLTALIAPALLITASASFVASTSTRLGSNFTRARAVADALREIASRGCVARPNQTHRWLELELRVTYRRVRLEQVALALCYAATIMFVACSLVLGIEAIDVFLHYWFPVVLGLCGVCLLLVACALLIVDVRLMMRLMRHEVALVRSVAQDTLAEGLRQSD